MPQVTRADLTVSVRKLIEEILQFHGWDHKIDERDFGMVAVELIPKELVMGVTANAKYREIRIRLYEDK